MQLITKSWMTKPLFKPYPLMHARAWLVSLTFFIVFSFSLLTMNPVFAATQSKPLPADQAFQLSVKVSHPTKFMLQWQIAPGYYLYRQELHITLIPNTPAEILYPPGKQKFDSPRGQYEIYEGKVVIPIFLQAATTSLPELNISYQGCSKEGFCYPPMNKNIVLNEKSMNANAVSSLPTPPLSALLTHQDKVQALFAVHHMGLIWLIFIGLGLLLAFTPCVLPMIPILTSLIVGQKESLVSTRKAFLLSLTYVLGSSLTYAMTGVIAALIGSSLQVWLQQTWVIASVSGLFILLGFSLFGLYEIRIPRFLQNRLTLFSGRQQGGTYLGVFLMGIISTLIVSPCVTAPLIGVLMYITQTGDVMLGASALFSLGIGMGLPLLVIGTSAGKLLPKSGPWMETMKKVFGVLMLGMAGWLLLRIASFSIIAAGSSLLLLVIAISLAIFSFREKKQIHTLSYVMLSLSVVLMAGALTMTQMFNNKDQVKRTHHIDHSFIIVRNLNDLTHQLTIAQALHKPVMLDFYADWCDSCVNMDKNVFSLPHIQRALKRFVLLRADLTANNAADEAILKNFDVIAPPTILFFNNDGREVNAYRIVGELNEKEFTARLSTFLTACDKKATC